MSELEKNSSNNDSEQQHDEIVCQVYQTLLNCVGAEKAVSAKNLSDWHGITQRKLRDIVNEIRISPDFEKVIGSCVKGYFVCSSKEEVDRTNRSLRHHALSELAVWSANEKKAGRDGQAAITFGVGGATHIESFGSVE